MSLPRQLMREPRLEMRLSRRGTDLIPVLGRYNYKAARPALSDHAHRGAMEICFLVRGRQTYLVGRDSYHLKGGDVFVTFPNERHSTGGTPEEKGVLYWLVLQMAEGWFFDLAPAPAKEMRRALLHLKSRHFTGSWKMKEHLDAVTRLYHERKTPRRALAIGNLINAFLLEVIACGQAASGKTVPRPLASVFRYIEEHLDEPIPVSRLAVEAGLSIARFKVRFKQETGTPPGEYVLRVRVEEAMRRLARKDATITEIAYDLGFSSSQYLATVFKRFTGRTPSSLRAAAPGLLERAR